MSMEPLLSDRFLRQLFRDLADGVLPPDLAAAIAEDATNWKAARAIAALVLDGSVVSAPTVPGYAVAVRERFVNAMLTPEYRGAIRRAAAEVAPVVGWSTRRRRALAREVIFCWEHRNDPAVEYPARLRSLADVLTESEEGEPQ